MKKNMAKFLIMLVLVVTAVLGVAVTAQAETYGGTAKGTKWSVDTATGVLTIDVEGPMGSWTQGSQPWYKYRSYITSIEFSQATSKITNYAFSDLVNLKTIEIPNSVEEVGTNAFINCQGATELYIPISVATWGGYVFQNCVSINYIYTENQANISQTAPIWDVSVGKNAADGKVELQIESKSIGAYSFYGLSTVTDVKLPTTLTSINAYAFYGFTSPFALDLKSATAIGDYAFYQCTGVTSINLPVATEVGANAFYGCTGAKSINLPVATKIGENAFQNCSGASTISVGATDVEFGSNAFAGCSGCTNLYLGSIGFTPGSNALNGLGTKSGVSITLGKSISSINGTLQGTHIGTAGKIDLKLEEGSTLVTVAASAFEGNTMLRSVDLSNRAGGLNVQAKAFNNCNAMEELSTNTGGITVATLSFGNLTNLRTLNYNSTETTNNGATFHTNITAKSTRNLPDFNLKQAHQTASSHTNYNGQGSRNGGYGVVGRDFRETLTYSISGGVEQIGNMAFYALSSGTTNGVALNIGAGVKSLPDYFFTQGFSLIEKTTAPSKTYYAVLYEKAGPGTNGYWHGKSYATAAVQARTVLSYPSKIKIGTVNSTSEALTYIGVGCFGEKTFEITTPVNTPAFQDPKYGGSPAVTGFRTNSTLNNSRGFWYQAVSNVSGTYSADAVANTSYSDSGGGNYISASQIGISTAADASLGQLYYYSGSNLQNWTNHTNHYHTAVWYGFMSAEDGNAILRFMFTGQKAATLTTTAQLTTSQSNFADSLTDLNLGVAGENSVIKDDAFRGITSLKNVYLASTIKGVNRQAFYTHGSGGTLYAYGKSASGEFTIDATGITTDNSLAVQYEPGVRDYGKFIDKYQVGQNVTAYCYETTKGNYLLNLAGSGATYETYTKESHPGWFASYGTMVKTVIIDDSVSSVGQYLFYGHTGLTTVQLGAGVTNISDYAFAGCSAFDEGTLQFTSAVTKIGTGAFANTATQKAVIPASVVTLGGKIFEGCSLESIAYNATAAADLSSKDVQPFTGFTFESKPSIIIGSNVTKVPKFLFYDCTAASVTIGASVTDIGIGAFGSMNNATFAVDAGNPKYTVGGDGNLYSDAAATMVVYRGSLQDEYYSLPATVTAIAAGAFYGQDYLLQVAFNASITTIGAQAFDACAKLETIAVSDFMDEDSFNAEVSTAERWSGDATVIFSGLQWDIGVTKGALTATLYSDGTLAIVGEGAMKNWASAASVDWNAKRSSITKVTFEGTPTSIGAYAFNGCDKLTTCVMPNTIDTIGQYAFYGCSSIANIRVPDKVTKIETYTFGNCVNMVWLDGGLGLKTIEPFAFSGCTNTRYIALNSTVAEVKDNAFTGDKNVTILIAGKQDKTDFDNYAGIPTKEKVDFFRICYMPDATNTKLVTRYVGNRQTQESSDYARETDLWVYAFDTDNDGSADYLHIAGGASMDTSWQAKDDVPWNDIRSTISKVYLEDDVTSVGAYAFEDCKNLAYVKIGKGCNTLSTHSFYNCPSLEMFVCNASGLSTSAMNADSKVFVSSGSKDGFAVVFKDDVTIIPAYMFQDCENLTSITIGKGVNNINSYAFAGCTGLKTVYLKGTNITSTYNNVFTNAGSRSGGFTVEIASNVTKIPGGLFYSTSSNPYVTSVFVDAGSKLQNIGTEAFKGCNRLERADFSNCTVLSYISNSAFADCTRLVTMDLSNCTELTTIAQQAFQNCMNLAAFSIQNDEKLQEIGANAFDGCVSVRDVVLPGSVQTCGSDAFKGWTKDQIIYVLNKAGEIEFKNTPSSWKGEATVVWTNLSWDMSKEQDKSIMAYYTLPTTPYANDYCIFVVGNGEMKDFENQNGLNWPGAGGSTDIRTTVTRIDIADGVSRIGNYNFAGFINCKSLTFGSSIKEIGVAAFKDDSLVPEVDLSPAAANLTMIENSAFENCSGVSTVNLSGCDGLESVGNDAFKRLAGSSSIYVSSQFLYDMLANTNGNIKSTYGTTANTKIVTVRVSFLQNLVSQGVRHNTQVVWHVEAMANDNLSFTWYYATEKGGQWTEITSAMTGYTIQSTTKESTLTMDPSIVTLDKNGWYFMVKAESPYYNEASNRAALAVYSSAITPVITVVDKNGDSLESNTWTQGPVTIFITEGSASNGITPTYQYKLKASGTWRNTEPKMLYNTEGIVTFYCRAIINGDSNTASEPVKYILKLDNTNPDVSISANPEFESTESVDLTATANDQTSGVASIGWYKTAADANEEGQNSGVTGYVPLLPDTDMNIMTLTVNHFKYNSTEYKVDKYTTTYTGKNEEHSASLNQPVDIGGEADTIANFTAATKAVTAKEITKFELYEVHVMNGESEDYAISASNKGVVTIPVPAGYDTNHLAVYQFNKTGILTPITNFSLNTAKTNVTFSVPSFGQYIIAEKSVSVSAEGEMEMMDSLPAA